MNPFLETIFSSKIRFIIAKISIMYLSANSSYFFSSYKRKTFYLFFFFFSCCLFFFTFDDFSEIRPPSSVEYHCSCWPTNHRQSYSMRCTLQSTGWTESYQRKGNVSSPFGPFFMLCAQQLGTVVYYSRPCYLTLSSV